MVTISTNHKEQLLMTLIGSMGKKRPKKVRKTDVISRGGVRLN